MKVGFSRLVMEFPAGLEMAGYVDRKGKAIGKHDDLEVFSIYLETESKAAAIVVFDVLGIPDGMSFDFEKIEVIPVATHTHSAPKPSSVIEYLTSYGEKAIEKSMEKKSNLEKIVLKRCGTFKICDLRDREGSVEIPVRIVEFHTKNGKFAILIYACHPTVLGPGNLLYSSDLSGALRRKMEEKFGFPVVYMNSCCGNISTHRTRKERTFEELERLSNIFVENLRCSEKSEHTPADLRLIRSTLELDLILKNVSGEIDNRAIPGLKLIRSRRLTPEMGRIDVSVLKIGKLNFVFEPCELFHETCGKLEDRAIIVNYANGYRPYLVPKRAKNTYEWIVSPYPEDSEDRFVDFIDSLIGEGDRDDGARAPG